ncbi:MAG: hypothetical protein ACRD2L_04765, partial [Terriglobia bacterium]
MPNGGWPSCPTLKEAIPTAVLARLTVATGVLLREKGESETGTATARGRMKRKKASCARSFPQDERLALWAALVLLVD